MRALTALTKLTGTIWHGNNTKTYRIAKQEQIEMRQRRDQRICEAITAAFSLSSVGSDWLIYVVRATSPFKQEQAYQDLNI